jgi:hypothetical protein
VPETLFQKVWNRHVDKAADEATLSRSADA